VLFAGPGKRAGQALGYSPWMQAVHVDNGAHLIGGMAEVTIVGATPASLTGQLAAIQHDFSEATA
jgi:tRNA-2-methylthio-N6-dimethylallyladenosine synthase